MNTPQSLKNDFDTDYLEIEKLKRALCDLGITQGDIVLLKGDLTEVGLIGGSAKSTLMAVFQALWDVLGGEENGTLITSSFTDAYFRWRLPKEVVFTEKSPSKGGGAITKYFLQHPRVKRSRHPTNSFVSIGRLAVELTSCHDETSRPYDPVGKVIELNGKVLSIGAVGGPPDFMTGHFAQQQAGYTRGSILSFLSATTYLSEGKIKLFPIKEVGGCSRGHFIVYSHYVKQKKLRTALFGKAYSIGMLAKDAFTISYTLQKASPRSFLCDDPTCFSCRGSWLWNMRDWPAFYLRNFWKTINKSIG